MKVLETPGLATFSTLNSFIQKLEQAIPFVKWLDEEFGYIPSVRIIEQKIRDLKITIALKQQRGDT